MIGACFLARRRVRRLFVAQHVEPGRARRLWSHLRGCPSCQSDYDRVLRLDRALADPGQAVPRPSPLELALVGALVQPPPPRARPGWTSLAVPVVGAAAVAAVLLAVRPMDDHVSEAERLGARGSEGVGLSVRAFCEQDDVVGQPLVRSLAREPAPQEVASCPGDGRVLFAAASREPGRLHVYLFAEDGDVLATLTPSAGTEVAEGFDLVPLPIQIDLSDFASHRTLRAVFVCARREESRDTLLEHAEEVLRAGAMVEGRGWSGVVRQVDVERSPERKDVP